MYVYNLTLCCNFINGSLFFLRLSFFRTLLSSQKNGEYRDFSHILCFYTCIAPSIINITHKSNTFVITDESTLTHLSHPKSTVYFDSSWCCTVYGFGWMYIDIYLSFWYYTMNFHLPEILHIPPIYSSLPPPPRGSHWSFYFLHCFGFFRTSYYWSHIVCSFLRLAFFHFCLLKWP